MILRILDHMLPLNSATDLPVWTRSSYHRGLLLIHISEFLVDQGIMSAAEWRNANRNRIQQDTPPVTPYPGGQELFSLPDDPPTPTQESFNHVCYSLFSQGRPLLIFLGLVPELLCSSYSSMGSISAVLPCKWGSYGQFF